jgi:hypothetical protein
MRKNELDSASNSMTPMIEETESLTNFAADPGRYLEHLRQNGSPMLLTVDGEPGLVVLDAASYQRFVESIDRMQTVAAVKEALKDVAAGRTRPVQEAMDEIARKYGFPVSSN